mgnify:CR=1 FL=1
MMSEAEIFEICNEVDSFIGDRLAESILHNVSFDMLEAHYGILPISRTGFYRKKRQILEQINMKSMQQETEKLGQKEGTFEV